MRQTATENHSIWGPVENNHLDEPQLPRKLCGSALIWQPALHLLPRDLILTHSFLLHIQCTSCVTFIPLDFTQKTDEHDHLQRGEENKKKNPNLFISQLHSQVKDGFCERFAWDQFPAHWFFSARVSSIDTQQLGEFPYFRRISWSENASFK